MIKIDVPDAEYGNVKIDSFTIGDKEYNRQLGGFYRSGRIVPKGKYKRLYINGEVMMSNTPDEIRDFSSFVSKANGDILVNGLGLGVLVQALLNKEDVESITVIEINEDVIKLVAPTYEKDKRFKVINADAFEYKPEKGVKFDYVWHDIWFTICSDNLPEMKKLHRKYGRRAKYQESWCRYECERQAKRDW